MEAMEGYGFQAAGKEESDIAFFISDSQLDEDVIARMPSVGYWWGWHPERIYNHGFQIDASKKIGLLKQCTRVLTPSPEGQDQLYMLGVKSEICLPGVDMRYLSKVQVAGDRKVQVVFLSRLAEHKGLDVLIEAMSCINPKLDLVVLGPGDSGQYRDLAQRVGMGNNIQFLEPTDEEKATILAGSAVLAFPSRYEGFGLPPLEALVAGTPVIAWDIPILRWTLAETAYFASSVDNLAGTIVHVLDHWDEAGKRALEGRNRVLGAFTMDHYARRLWPHLHQVAKAWWGKKVHDDPHNKALMRQAYEAEGRRNWAYGMGPPEWNGAARFNPSWSRHWRAQAYIRELKAAGVHRVLDLGSGPVYPCIFGLNGFEVTGFDIAEETLSQAKFTAEKWDVGHLVSIRQGMAQDLPWAENTWEGVVIGELIEHVPDPEKVLAEAYRVLKPGGVMMLTTPYALHHWDPMHMGPVQGGWDDASIARLLAPYGKQVILQDKIAEQGTDPSTYLVVVKKEP